MDPNSKQSSLSANSIGRPPKPWERAGSSSSTAPFRCQSHGSTSDVVEASGTAKPGEIVSTSHNNATINRNAIGRPLPARPWQQNHANSSYRVVNTGYSSTLNYNSRYRPVRYVPYDGGMGGHGLGGGPNGAQDPNNPRFWISFLRVMERVVNFFGQLAFLIDQNTQAVHMFMTALLQLFDLGGLLLYGEIARFVLRLLGIRTEPKKMNPQGTNGLPSHKSSAIENHNEGTKATPSGSWENNAKK